MKTLFDFILVLTGASGVCSLASCNMGDVSIDQRIVIFQSDFNTSDRSNLYQDFMPTVADYALLKTPSSAFNTNFPPKVWFYPVRFLTKNVKSRANESLEARTS